MSHTAGLAQYEQRLLSYRFHRVLKMCLYNERVIAIDKEPASETDKCSEFSVYRCENEPDG